MGWAVPRKDGREVKAVPLAAAILWHRSRAVNPSNRRPPRKGQREEEEEEEEEAEEAADGLGLVPWISACIRRR